MTNYNLKPPIDNLARPPLQEAREKRKKQLEGVQRRRRVIYQLMRKMHIAR